MLLKVLFFLFIYDTTPIISSIENDDIEIFKLLLSHPATDINCVDNNGVFSYFSSAPINIALSRKNEEVIKLLFQRKDLNTESLEPEVIAQYSNP